nr:hypothetical protein [Pseudomonas sp. HS-2]
MCIRDSFQTAHPPVLELAPVSYTQLDVYKRQLPDRPSTGAGAGPCLLYTTRCV